MENFIEDMTKSLLLDYKALEQLMGNFETVYSQISSPVDISQAIFLDTLMKKLDKLFDRCVKYIYKYNEKTKSYILKKGITVGADVPKIINWKSF